MSLPLNKHRDDYNIVFTESFNSKIEYIKLFMMSSLLALILILLHYLLIPQGNYYSKVILFPLTIALSMSVATLHHRSIDIKDYLKNLNNNNAYNIISVLYSRYLWAVYKKTCLSLIVLAIVLGLISIKVDNLQDNLFLSLAPIFTIMILLCRLKLIELRVSAGVFGTNSHEVKELISFINANSDEIDFTDSDGKLKRAFLPEHLLDESLNLSEVKGGNLI